MSDCSSGEYSVSCSGGCGLICTSTHCYGWCEPVVIDIGELDFENAPGVEPTVIEVSRDGEAKDKPTFEGDDSVELCANGLSRDGLVAGLQSILGTELEPSGADDGGEKELPFSGTVDELLEHLDLRRGAQHAAS